MRTMKVLVLLSITCLFGCGGGGGGSNGGGGVIIPTITVIVSPDNPTIGVGDNETFTADVTGTSNTSVNWSIQEGSAGGTISAAGVYSSNTPGTYHIIATSLANKTISGTTTVIVVAPIITVTVSPSNPTILAGTNETFTANVTGTSNTSVNWSIQEGAAGGLINANGVYSCNTPGTYHIIATSQANKTVTGTTAVTVQGGNVDGTIQ